MTEKTYPTDGIFVLCEDIREETKGTKTLVGVYPGRRIGVPQGTKEIPLYLALVWMFSDGEGSYSQVMELTGPNGRLESPAVRCESARGMTVGLNLRPSPPMVPGKYTVTCRLDDHEYSSSFEIIAGLDVKAGA